MPLISKPIFYIQHPLLSSQSPTRPAFQPVSGQRRKTSSLLLLLGALCLCGWPAIAQQAAPVPSARASLAALEVHPGRPSVAAVLAQHQSRMLALRQQQLAIKIAKTYRVEPAKAREIVLESYDVASRHRIDPLLLLAIVAVESSFNPQAVSSVGALGLTQAMERWHPEKFHAIRANGQEPFEVAASLELGGWIYSEYLKRFQGNETRALQQYNGSLHDTSLTYSRKVQRAKRWLASGLPGGTVAGTAISVAQAGP